MGLFVTGRGSRLSGSPTGSRAAPSRAQGTPASRPACLQPLCFLTQAHEAGTMMIPILQKRKLRLRAWTSREPAIVPAASCLPLGADQPGLGRKGPVFQGFPTITWVDKLLSTERSPQRPRRQRGPGKLRGLRNAAPLCCILRPWGCMWQHPVPYPESQSWEVAGGSLLQKGPSPGLWARDSL